MPLYMASDDFIYKRRPKRTKPLRPCIQCSSVEVKHRESSTSTEGECRAKKRVSFADHKGLALTMVKIFSEFDDPIEIPYNIQELIDKVVNLSVERDSLVLDFEQPSADYLAFRQRLENDHVCLENCMLKEKTLVGTVKVKNLAFEKSVKLRVTFNTWKSFLDHQCQYVNDIYTGSDRDTFSFEIDLPHNIPPHERIEFALCYTSNGKDFWDSNQGQNYKETVDKADTFPNVLQKVVDWLKEKELGTKHKYAVLTDGGVKDVLKKRLKSYYKKQKLMQTVQTESITEDSFQEYVKPEVNSQLSDFCVQLTGITQETVDKADTFPNVLQKVPRTQTKLTTMLGNLGMKYDGRPHCGLDDSRNIARIAMRMLQDGCVLRVNERMHAGQLMSVSSKAPVEGAPPPHCPHSRN
ncbi:UNVERIFIED_CONTAM: hypothetical protein FKN15_076564 [Acipenser sinensis]